MPQGAAGIAEGDYRSIGKTDLICVSVEGEGTKNKYYFAYLYIIIKVGISSLGRNVKDKPLHENLNS